MPTPKLSTSHDAQAYQHRATEVQQNMTQLANSGELADYLYAALRGEVDDLTQVQLDRLSLYSFGVAINFDSMLYQYEQGFLDSEWFESSFEAGVRLNAQLWTRFQQLERMRPAFRQQVERILKSST
jgi:hypothetical protein